MRLFHGIFALTIGVLSIPSLIEAATYHIDCDSGLDSRTGTSPDAAWKSLSKASTADLQPGDSLRLRRGCAWTGPLQADWGGSAEKPILMGPYGTGELPVIENGNPANVRIGGHDVVVESLWVRSRPVMQDTGCRGQPVGGRSGFEFRAGSFGNTLRGVKVSGHSIGVFMATGSRRNRVLESEIFDNVALTVNDKANPDNDAGAFGILVNGDSNQIAYNRFSNNLAWCSYDYGSDGSSVEIYNGRGNRIHHNRAYQEGAFTELGGSRTEDNTFAYNLLASDVETCVFLNVRGAAGKWGPNTGTRVFHNTVYLTGSKSQGVVCSEGCSPAILDLKNNILWAGWKAVFVDSQPDASHNLFWRSGGNPLMQNLKLTATSRILNPEFVDAAKGDFRLKTGSPALDVGTSIAGLPYVTDLAGTRVPVGTGPDIGAQEGSAPVGVRDGEDRRKTGAFPGTASAGHRDAAGRSAPQNRSTGVGFPWRR